MPRLHCRRGWLIDEGLHGADIRRFSGGAPIADRGTLRSGWLQTDLVVRGYALLCTDVRPGIGIHSVVLIKEGWLPRTRLAKFQSTVMQRDCLVHPVTTATKLLLWSVLPDASDRGLLI